MGAQLFFQVPAVMISTKKYGHLIYYNGWPKPSRPGRFGPVKTPVTKKDMNPKEIKALALAHFEVADQKLYRLAESHLHDIDPPAPMAPDRRAEELMRIIIGQQISTRAANSIWQRLRPKLFLADGSLANPALGALVDNGASTGKARSILALRQALVAGQLDLAVFDDWTDDEVIADLSQYPGIGPWTAEMFLIRALGRPDVFSLRDLGLRTALSRLHGLAAEADQLEPLAEKYSPHGTLAALVCWRSLNNGDL